MKIYAFVFALLFIFALQAQSQTAAEPQSNATKPSTGAIDQQHDYLAALVGQWTATTKFAANKEQTESGNTEVKAILGGRFVWMETKDTAGTKVKIVGYDNIDRKYQTTWMGDQRNEMIQLKGVSNNGTTFTFLGGHHDAEAQPIILRAVLTITDKDHFAWECSRMEKDGKPTKIMEVAYARRQ